MCVTVGALHSDTLFFTSSNDWAVAAKASHPSLELLTEYFPYRLHFPNDWADGGSDVIATPGLQITGGRYFDQGDGTWSSASYGPGTFHYTANPVYAWSGSFSAYVEYNLGTVSNHAFTISSPDGKGGIAWSYTTTLSPDSTFLGVVSTIPFSVVATDVILGPGAYPLDYSITDPTAQITPEPATMCYALLSIMIVLAWRKTKIYA